MLRAALRMMRETDPRLLIQLAWKVGVHGSRLVARHRRTFREGGTFPPFLFVSVTNRCNLQCTGCWVEQTDPPVDMPPDLLDAILSRAEREGNRFFGIMGGEPLLYEPLFDVLRRHRRSYFQLFTNGHRLTDDVAAVLRRLGNVTPLISIEGLEEESDRRRGGAAVFARSMEAVAACRRHRLVIGTATSVCAANIDDVVNEAFLRGLIRRGVHYAWYYIYRPAGRTPAPEQALDRAQVRRLRRFLVDVRGTLPLLVVDAYWDQDGRALCPAAAGISHHINPMGCIEPCPPAQFACDRVTVDTDLAAVFRGSRFLRDFGTIAEGGGCVLLDDPPRLARYAAAYGAVDTGGRGVDATPPARCGCSHRMDGEEIPERHWAYRLAKRNWFCGFGSYG